MARTDVTKSILRSEIQKGGFIDVGKGAHFHLGITQALFYQVLRELQEEGYLVMNVQVAQRGTNRKKTLKVLGPPGAQYSEVDPLDIRAITKND